MREWVPSVLTSSARTEHTDISRKRFSETIPGTVAPIRRFFKLPRNGVANTIRAGSGRRRGGFTSPRSIHYDYPRCITVREMARLRGFPDWYRFSRTKWHGARQIGNAIPPPLGRIIATEVSRALDIQPVRPRHTMALGDAKLLSLSMSEAAKVFKAQPISGRIDRKSGVRKRRQADIERERLERMSIHG